MNRTLKNLLKIDIVDVMSVAFVTALVFAFIHYVVPPAHPISIFIGSVLGNRLGSYYLHRNDPEDDPKE